MTPEIRAFEYALGLFAVLIGLAVADVATSFHRLARSRGPVVWDPLTLLAAAFALCMAIGMWFDLWGVRGVPATRHFFYYLSMVAEFFVLFLIAAASLPDEVREGCDLREHYARNRRYFWLLVALFQLSYLANGLYFVGSMLAHMHLADRLWAANNLCVPLLISLLLATVSSRAVHYAGIALLFVSFAVHYAPYQIN
ncbi:MAG TPA: hypothetical protein VH109_14815 [Steroidobacteraceae bacterium]|nr:hypothetical protein [Steroidobacteraceae bacterium]